MMEATMDLCSNDHRDNHALHSTHPTSRRSLRLSGALMLLFAGLTVAISLPAKAEPVANTVFSECTFTTGASNTRGTLNSVLNISQTNLNKLAGGEIQASYILIYTRLPNDGQDLASSTSFTGPILCRNTNTTVVPTTETNLIPDPARADSVNILDAEEVTHLRYEPNIGTQVGPAEKRVCHTVASNTNCFIIRPNP